MVKYLPLLFLLLMSDLQDERCVDVQHIGTYSLESLGIQPGTSDLHAKSIVVSGTNGYLVTYDSLVILDLSDDMNPSSLSKVMLPSGFGSPNGEMIRVGNILYVCMSVKNVVVINVEDQDAPYVLTIIETSGEIYDIDGSGHIVYLAGSDGLLSVNIINAASPEIFSQIKDFGGASGLRIIGDYLYVSFNKYPYQLTVFSITSGIPVFINSISITNIAGTIEFIPPFMLFTRSFTFVDISNPEIPRVKEDRIPHLDYGLEVADFSTDERYIYIVGSAAIPDDLYIDAFMALDAINPTHEKVGEWLRFGFDTLRFSRMDQRDSFFFIADGIRGLIILKVEDNSGVKDMHWCLYQ